MKQIAALALVAILTLTNVACVKNTTPGNPAGNTPNVGVVVALETAAAACDVGSTLVTGPITVWLSGPCAAGMTAIINVVEANGTLAQFQAALTGLQNTAASLPPGTPYLNYANAAIALAKDALNAYALATGQTVTASTAPAGAAQFFAAEKPHKLKLTKAEKDRIEAARQGRATAAAQKAAEEARKAAAKQ
jgi:hypothetical protein